MKVVIDTNVFVSAVVNPHGKPAQLLRSCFAGEYLPMTSPSILREFEKVLKSPRLKEKYNLTNQSIRDLLSKFRKVACVTKDLFRLKVVEEDPADDKFLACALEGKADFLVSGNRHLLGLGKYYSVRVVSVENFLKILSR